MDSSDEEYFASSSLLNLIINKKECRKNSINAKRNQFGEFHNLYNDLRKDPDRFQEYTRMSIETFDYILEKIAGKLNKIWSNFITAPITPCERLIVTLRYFITGASFTSLAFSFRIGRTTVGNIVKETTNAIWEELFPLHMSPPTEQYFEEVAAQYWKLWDFPNCIGAIAGKFIEIKCPPSSRSKCYNYKHVSSIVLHGIADASCKIIAIEVGGYGKQSNDGTFSSSQILQLLKSEKLQIPQNRNLPNTNQIVPYVFLGDEAYPLLECLIRPYSKKECTEEHEYFNARLSRARQCIEYAFGIINAKFKILGKPIATDPSFAVKIVKCICLLHNIIVDREGLDEGLKKVVEKAITNKSQKEYNEYNEIIVANGTVIRDQFCNFVCHNKLI